MKAQPRLGLAVSWPRVTLVFLIDVAVLAAAGHWPAAWQSDHIAWWVGVGVAAVVTIVSLLSYRGVPLISALATGLSKQSHTEAGLTAGRTPAIDHRRRYGRAPVGVREYRGSLVAVLAVDASAAAQSLPVEVIAAALHRFDVRLDGIDIVSVATREAAGGDDRNPRHAAGDSGDRRPTVDHGTWLVLRMDPQRNVAAMAARDSVASAMAAVAERLAHDLARRHYEAQPLTDDDLADLDFAVLAGLQPGEVRSQLRYLKHPYGYVASFWVSPRDVTAETLNALWLHAPAAVETTVVIVRLTARHGGAEISAWVRYHSSERLGKEVWSGLNPLIGRQLAAVRASLPVPARRSPLVVPARMLGNLERLVVSVGPAPQSIKSAGGR